MTTLYIRIIIECGMCGTLGMVTVSSCILSLAGWDTGSAGSDSAGHIPTPNLKSILHLLPLFAVRICSRY